MKFSTLDTTPAAAAIHQASPATSAITVTNVAQM